MQLIENQISLWYLSFLDLRPRLNVNKTKSKAFLLLAIPIWAPQPGAGKVHPLCIWCLQRPLTCVRKGQGKQQTETRSWKWRDQDCKKEQEKEVGSRVMHELFRQGSLWELGQGGGQWVPGSHQGKGKEKNKGNWGLRWDIILLIELPYSNFNSWSQQGTVLWMYTGLELDNFNTWKKQAEIYQIDKKMERWVFFIWISPCLFPMYEMSALKILLFMTILQKWIQ